MKTQIILKNIALFVICFIIAFVVTWLIKIDWLWSILFTPFFAFIYVLYAYIQGLIRWKYQIRNSYK